MLYDLFVISSPWIEPFLLIYFSLVNLIYALLLIGGAFKIYLRRKELSVEDFTNILGSESLPEITLLVPAYNESKMIVSLVKNLLHLAYRYKQIIIVNDGSTDNSFALLQNEFQLVSIGMLDKQQQFPLDKQVLPTKLVKGVYRSVTFPELLVVDKENGTRYDALNAGLNVCNTSYFITVDADTFIDDEGFEALIRPLLSDKSIIAVGASVRVSNGCELNYNRIVASRQFPENYTTAMQTNEYLRTFMMRLGWDYIGGNFGMSGAFSVFRTDAVTTVGGFSPTFSQDLEIILRLHKVMRMCDIPYKIIHIPDPVAWTKVPRTLKRLGAQRRWWQRGIIDSVWIHKDLMFNPKFGWFGLFVFPFLVLAEAFEHFVEILAIIYAALGLYLHMINLYSLILLLLLIWGFTVIYTLSCLLIEELSFRRYPYGKSMALLILASCTEIFGYRQLSLIWRMKGTIDFFKKFAKAKEFSKLVSENVKQAVKNLREEGAVHK